MERYKVIKEVGDGTFGSVWRAINKQTGEIVAIKKMKRKYYSWEECMNLREVKALRRMNHPNIIKLKEVIRENDILYFVFEYMECNLYQLMKTHGRPYSEPEIRIWCFQIFQGLAYMHQRGYFHRDMKPENLLVSKDVIKIADFGLAREICSRPPFTEYVSTRWYRAPEILLSSPTYDSAVDMWAMGAIMAELFTNRPLFPGISEADEIYKICSVIGTPTESSWSEGLLLAQMLNYQFPKLNCVNLSSLLPSASASAIDLISSLCLWDPHKRPTAAVVLQHPFFQSCYYIPPSLRVKDSLLVKTPPSVGISSALEQKGTRRYTNGPVYNAKPTSILTSKPYASLRSGVQRKLEMENQDIGKHVTKGYTGQVQYPPYLKNNYSDCVYPVRQAAGVSELTEKLGQMSLMHPLPLQMRHPQSQLQQQQAPALKAGGWHCVAAERGNEIPPAKFYYPRKVRG